MPKADGSIGPGDWVECINAEPYDGRAVPLVVGQRYQVLAVWDYLPHMGKADTDWFDCAVDLVDVPGPEPDIAWGLYRFKPLGGGEPAQGETRELADA